MNKIKHLCGNCSNYNPYWSEIYDEIMHWGGCKLKGDNYRDTEEDKTCPKWSKNIDGWIGGYCSKYTKKERGDL